MLLATWLGEMMNRVIFKTWIKLLVSTKALNSRAQARMCTHE